MIGIEHVGIFSKDSEALKNWYIELFGWKEVYTNAEKKTYFLKADDGAMIEFCLTKEEGAPFAKNTEGIRHIAISVDDFDAVVKKVKDCGAEIVDDAAVSAKGIGTMFFKDPDGNILHLIYRPEKL